MKRGQTTLKGQGFQEFKVPVKVYDAEKKQLLATFESQTDAAKYLGVRQSVIVYALRNKSRIKRTVLGIIACIR